MLRTGLKSRGKLLQRAIDHHQEIVQRFLHTQSRTKTFHGIGIQFFVDAPNKALFLSAKRNLCHLLRGEFYRQVNKCLRLRAKQRVWTNRLRANYKPRIASRPRGKIMSATKGNSKQQWFSDNHSLATQLTPKKPRLAMTKVIFKANCTEPDEWVSCMMT